MQKLTNTKSNGRSIINYLLIICGLVYLACIPLGHIDKHKKLQPVDIGIIMVLVIANSDLIQRISSLNISQKGFEVALNEFKEEHEKKSKQKEELNAKVLSSIDLYLSETVDHSIDDEVLKNQIDKGSLEVVEYIYFRAKEARHRAWRDHKKKGIIERTIPIFRALINSQHGKGRHRFHAQLGYALKDQATPKPQDWEEAEKHLDTAITIWKKENKDKSNSLPPYYCFNWLICMSKIDKNKKITYNQDIQNKVNERLQAINACKPLQKAWNNCTDANEWLSSNFPNIETKKTENTANGSCHKESYLDYKQNTILE